MACALRERDMSRVQRPLSNFNYLSSRTGRLLSTAFFRKPHPIRHGPDPSSSRIFTPTRGDKTASVRALGLLPHEAQIRCQSDPG